MKKIFVLGALVLTGCGTAPNIETHSALSGAERNQMATKLAAARAGEFDMNDYFSGPRELKNACIVGLRYKATVNDNTANSKSSVTSAHGMVTTTTISFDFKPSPFYFQQLTDYSYDRFASELKRYGYNVIDKTTMNSSKAYTSKGENGHSSQDKESQYSGYYHMDPQNVRYYDFSGYSVNRMLATDDDWAKELLTETKCDVYFNAELLNGMKVTGSTEVDGINALGVASQINFAFNANVPWALWEKSMKEIDSKIYANNNHGGTSAISKPINVGLVYPLGENAGVPEATLQKLNAFSEGQLRKAIDLAIDYSLRAFHLEVYKQKNIPATQASNN